MVAIVTLFAFVVNFIFCCFSAADVPVSTTMLPVLKPVIAPRKPAPRRPTDTPTTTGN